MRWSCKICSFRSSKHLDFLKHYRLHLDYTLVKADHCHACTQTVLVHLKVGVLFPHICSEIIHKLNSQGKLCHFHVLYVIHVVITPRGNILNTSELIKNTMNSFVLFYKIVTTILIYIQLLPHLKVGSTILTALKILNILHFRHIQVRKQQITAGC